jgi:hypothetical protein
MPAPYDQLDYYPLRTFAFEALSVGATAVEFTAATALSAKCATAKVETAQIRYRTDGTDPTATVGVLADVGDIITVYGSADVQAFRAIRTGGTSGTLSTEFSR